MQRFGLVSTIGFVAGGAGVVTGVVLLATAPKRKAVVTRIHPWIVAGLLVAKAPPAMAGVEGAW
jgi:hypothetical protein